MDYAIIEATNRHASQISELIFDIWINEYHFKVFPENYPDLQNIDTAYHGKGGCFWVALFNQTVVGTIACDKLSSGVYVLKRMFLRRDLRGKGIASTLLQKLFEGFFSKTVFYLSTKEDLALAAKKLYLRNGFEQIDRESLPEGFPLFYEDDLFMKKIL